MVDYSRDISGFAVMLGCIHLSASYTRFPVLIGGGVWADAQSMAQELLCAIALLHAFTSARCFVPLIADARKRNA